MCGIAGIIDLRRGTTHERLGEDIAVMSTCLRHRGPDSWGVWVEESAGIALGHCRLAILDLSPTGHQPMRSASDRFVITFNGEIYNYRDLRRELANCGHRFEGTSDTEVMLEAFSEWGVEASLKKIVGMFAFALWDRAERVLYLARDRIGEKPLYYGWIRGVFLFGSELKALRAHPRWHGEIDRDVLALFFRHNHVPTPYSIYRGIRKLPPGTILSISPVGTSPSDLPEPVPYWSLRNVAVEGTINRFQGTEEEAVDRLEALLKEAISGQMISDVPLGAFLSGGVDSSMVVALMQSMSNRPVKTFTIGFDDIAYNEAPYARRVAKHLGTEHTEHYVTAKEAMDVVPVLPYLYDEPFADSSQIPTYLVSRLARRHVTVCLSGDGGDEVFCGYNIHVKLEMFWKVIKGIPRPIRRALAEFLLAIPASLVERVLRGKIPGILYDQMHKIALALTVEDPEEMYLRLTSFWGQSEVLVLNSIPKETMLTRRKEWPADLSSLEQLLYLTTATILPDDMLVKLDRSTMGVSLETRVPYLDHRVLEYAWSLPIGLKLRGGVGKWVLRKVLYKYVPPELIERPKAGFGIPVDIWLKGPLREWAEGLLGESRIRRDGYLNYRLINKKWTEHLSGRRKWQTHLWGVLMFNAWLDTQ